MKVSGKALPVDLCQQLKAWADIEGVSVDALVSKALREYLDRHIGDFTNGA